jgi:uncharacterized protein YkwD
MLPLRLLASYATRCLVLFAVVVISSLTAFADEGDTSSASDGTLSEVTYDSFFYLPLVGSCLPGMAEKYPADNRGYELELLRLINEQRAAAGLPLLTEQAALTQAARRQAEDMANNDIRSHTGSDGSQPQSRAEEEGYVGTLKGEAAGINKLTPQDAVSSWMGSAPHRGIVLMADADQIGIAYAYDPAGINREIALVDLGASR